MTVLAIIERSLCNAKKDCKRDRWGHSASCDAAGGAGELLDFCIDGVDLAGFIGPGRLDPGVEGEQVGLEGDGGFVTVL